jgi:hypothetical protein
LANIAGLDTSRIEIRQFNPQLRDTMLLTKQVDAVTGFDSTVLPSSLFGQANFHSRDNMKRGYRTGWRTWKGPEQGRSAGRPPRACSKILGIRASFQRDNLR